MVEPLVVARSQHTLSRRDIDPNALRVLYRLHEAHFIAYLVGGSVRDLLLGRPVTDLDFATDARPDDIESIVSPLASDMWTMGREFGTIGALVGGRHVEVTTYRADVYAAGSRKPAVTFGDDLRGDLLRRDFTVNAMAIRPEDGTLVDPFGGVGHLARKVLATPRDPRISFAEDPLRMLRAARFVAQLGLGPTEEVRAAITSGASDLEHISAERIRDELSRLITRPKVTEALWLLVDTGLMDHFLPEVPAMRVEQDPVHRHKDVLTHSIAVTQKTSPRLVVRLAALLHDIAKPKTRSIGPKGVQFHHHDVVGAKMARQRLRALKYPSDVVDAVSQLVFLHLRVHTYRMGWSDSAVRRYVRDAGPHLADLNELVRCDCTTRNRRRARELQDRMDELERRVAVLSEQEELAKIRPEIDGREVMEHLGIGPGPVVGEALEHLLGIRLDEGELGREEALKRLDAWWRERGEHPAQTGDGDPSADAGDGSGVGGEA